HPGPVPQPIAELPVQSAIVSTPFGPVVITTTASGSLAITTLESTQKGVGHTGDETSAQASNADAERQVIASEDGHNDYDTTVALDVRGSEDAMPTSSGDDLVRHGSYGGSRGAQRGTARDQTDSDRHSGDKMESARALGTRGTGSDAASKESQSVQ